VTSTGPQTYPGASKAAWYQDNFGGDSMEVNVVCLHTTEGSTLPDYNGGSVAPNLTAVPDFGAKKLKWYQHFDIDTSSRALVNLRGGVETNTNNVCQVELVGTCDPATHAKWTSAGRAHIFWPEAPDWALKQLADFLWWMNQNHNVPLVAAKTWLPYPQSGNADSSARMTFAQWNAFKGVCGHMHVPENTHGDPGNIQIDSLMALAGRQEPAPQEDPDMLPTTLTEIQADGPSLKAGEWTMLKMAEDSAILQGACQYTVACYVQITGMPGTRVTGRFQDLTMATNRPSADLPQDGGTIGVDSILNAVFTRPGDLASGEQLKLEVMADSDAKVTYRLVRGLVWRA